jgi:predicted alpha/beta-fold hydrolase
MLKVVETQFPKANIYLAGTSMGATYIQRYAGLKGECQEMVNVKALGCISGPYCVVQATNHIATSFWTRNAMLRLLISSFQAHITEEKFLLALKKRDIDPQMVLGSKSSDEFNKHFSIKFTTHPDIAAYKKAISSIGYVRHIDVPTIAINSRSDLISPFAAVPFDEIAANPKFIQVTVNGGGHLEYFSGNNMRRWGFDVVLTFFKDIESDLNTPTTDQHTPHTIQSKS